jgi:hypothetical protein
MKSMKKIAAFGAALGFSLTAAYSLATTVVTNYAFYENPYAYTNMFGCTWQYTGSQGGTWGVQFHYTATGSCQYSKMDVTGTRTGNPYPNQYQYYATIYLN